MPPPLKQFIWDNRFFLGACLTFFTLGIPLLWWLENGDAVFFFSDRRTEAGDMFFKTATRLGEEFSFIIAFVGLLFVRIRSAVFIPILALMITLTSFTGKSVFGHPRPYPYLEATGQLDRLQPVDGVRLNKGNTSYPSGHTMAGFGLFGFLAFVLNRKKGIAFCLFLLASITGISRVYLAQHFYEDIYLGALLGVLLAIGGYYFHFLIPKYPNARWDNTI